jgi:hypothetical protein
VARSSPASVALCTTCSKRKRRIPASPIPAARRYLSARIGLVLRAARLRGLRALILSGRYGLLSPSRRIPWYDQALLPENVEEMASKVERRLRELGVGEVELWARPATTPGWRPYHDVLRLACAKAGVRLRVVALDERYP